MVTLDFIKAIIDESTVPVVVDAGIGAPVMRLWLWRLAPVQFWLIQPYRWLLDPVAMAGGFCQGNKAGREEAYLAVWGAQSVDFYSVSQFVLTSFLND